MTTLLGDAICNIEEEECQEACQHALKNPYEARTSDEDEEGGEAPSDDDEGSNNKSEDEAPSDDGDGEDDSNNDSKSKNSDDYDSQYSGNNQYELPSDREDEDVGLFYVDYYDGDIEDDAKVEPIDMENGTNSEEYELENVLEAVEEEVEVADNIDYDDYLYGWPSNWSCIIDASSRLGPNMISMVEKFLSQGYSIIQNLAHWPHTLRKKTTQILDWPLQIES